MGDYVIVKTARGEECGEVAKPVHEVPDSKISKPLRPALRMADAIDLRRMEKNRADEKRAFDVCAERIEKHKLDMKLVDVEYTLDRSKILFYFTADGRVDFRDLVKDLAGVFHTRIELRQIGVRDESKMLGRAWHLRPALLLQPFFEGFSACFHQNGKSTGPLPEPGENIGFVRTADVLPCL